MPILLPISLLMHVQRKKYISRNPYPSVSESKQKKMACNKDKLEYTYAKVFDFKSSWKAMGLIDFILKVCSAFKRLNSTVTGRCNDFTIAADTQIATNHCTQNA